MGELFAVGAIALLWNFLNGELTAGNTIVGVLLALLILSVMNRTQSRSLPSRIWNFVKYLGNFFLELLLAGFQVARLVVTPRPRYHPHIISVPLTLKSDGAITLLTLTVALIPGTVPMGASDDRKFFYAHAINAADPDVNIRGVLRIERLILGFTE